MKYWYIVLLVGVEVVALVNAFVKQIIPNAYVFAVLGAGIVVFLMRLLKTHVKKTAKQRSHIPIDDFENA